jgi:hypothetical protein
MENEPKSKSKEDLEAERRDERTVEQLLSDVGAGWSVSLTRIRPSWCKGWLETIDASPDEKLDMEYIADTWGGETIRIRLLDTRGRYKGGKDFHVAREPRDHGRPLEHPDDKRERLAREDRQREKLERQEEQARLNAIQPAQQDTSVFTLLLDVLKDSNVANSQVYKDLAKMQTKDPMGIEQIVSFANGLKDLQGVFGGEKNDNNNNDDQMLGAFLKIMDNAGERDKKKNELKEKAIAEHRAAREQGKHLRPVQGRQLPPTGRQGQQAPKQNPTTPAPPLAPQPDQDETEELALSEELAELSAMDAAEVLGEAFTMMPIEKRQKTIKLLLAFANAGNAADILTGDGESDPLDDSTTEDGAAPPDESNLDTSFKPSGTET